MFPSGETVWRPADPHAWDHLQEREAGGKGRQRQPHAGGGRGLWLRGAPAQEETEHWAGGERRRISTSEEASRHHRALHHLLHVLLHTEAAKACLLITKDQDRDQTAPAPPCFLITSFCPINSSLTGSFLKPTWTFLQATINGITLSQKTTLLVLEPARTKNRQTCENVKHLVFRSLISQV